VAEEPVGHLLAGHEQHVLACAVGDGEVLADDVVVGEREEVQADAPALRRPLRRRQRAAALERVRALRGVGVQVTAVPARLVQHHLEVAADPEQPARRPRDIVTVIAYGVGRVAVKIGTIIVHSPASMGPGMNAWEAASGARKNSPRSSP
jgi:hypothetical protein